MGEQGGHRAGWRRPASWFAVSGLALVLLFGIMWILTGFVMNYTPNNRRLQPADFDRLAAQTPGVIEKERYQSIDGVKLVAWYLRADRPPGTEHWAVILTHGGGDDKSYYLPLALQLRARGFDVLLPDLRGHGESGPSPGGLTLGIKEGQDVAAAAAFLADRKHIRNITALGVSMGGVATVIGAAADPRIGPLILESTSYRPAPVYEQLLAVFGLPDGTVRSGIARVLASFGLWRMGASGWDIWHGLLPAWRLSGKLSGHPALFIFGDRDPFVRAADIRVYAKRFGPYSRICIFPNNGHGVYRKHPAEYSALLFKFLDDWRTGTMKRHGSIVRITGRSERAMSVHRRSMTTVSPTPGRPEESSRREK